MSADPTRAAGSLPDHSQCIARRLPESRANQWLLEVDRALLAARRTSPAVADSGSAAGAGLAGADSDDTAVAPAAADRAAAAAGASASVGPQAAGAARARPALSAAVPTGQALAAGSASIGAGAAGRQAGHEKGRTEASHAAAGQVAPLMAALQPLLPAGAAPRVPSLADLAQAAPESPPAEVSRGRAAPWSGTPATAAPGQQYGRRHVHLLVDDDGVHAYLRDAGLANEALLPLAAAMYGADALEPGTLASLTVNGRPVQLPASFFARAPAAAARALLSAGVDPVPPEPIEPDKDTEQ